MYISPVAMTKEGMVTPRVAMAMIPMSCQRPFFRAATMPRGIDASSTKQMVTRPSRAETGKPLVIKSFTDRPAYLNEGPRSPWSRSTM